MKYVIKQILDRSITDLRKNGSSTLGMYQTYSIWQIQLWCLRSIIYWILIESTNSVIKKHGERMEEFQKYFS